MKEKENGLLPITDDRMTRFNITLQEGVDFVLNCFERMWGGELFIPKIPSYRIMDVAEAIAPKCKHEIVGIRPGEKLHEEMITQTDSINTVEFKDYYVILPSTPLWDIEKFINDSGPDKGKKLEYGFAYNSGENHDFLSVEKLKQLINSL